ncbi:MAG: signal recognition particle-docking protein FtsY [Candidatus Micrarchaeia archaeon]
MFENLRKKFSEFASSIIKKEEKEEKEEQKEEQREERKEEQNEEQREEAKAEAIEKSHEEAVAKVAEKQERRGKRADISTRTKVAGTLLRNVKLSSADIAPFIEELKIDLVKSDVNYDVAEKISESLEKELVGKEVNIKEASKSINEEIRKSLSSILSKSAGADIIAQIKQRRASGETPYKILFLGPNGAGKTTTIAKFASMLKQNGISCVISASDTFRAAAIEQIGMHASKLGVEVVKGAYGADPASVAYDAIAHAKSHAIDCVLIDTAGRQETNKSLVEELKKIARVNKPDLALFVGESIAGNALLNQVKEFSEAIKIDGIILTKLDCDAKGGNTLSILSETTIPVMYFGTGEGYDKLVPYNPEAVLSQILPQ